MLIYVGIEMVMKPSLLILDEPTSGLDSSSSQLLLKALRREALEGTNICAVIHQPRLPTKSHFGLDNSEVSQYNDSFCSAAIHCTVCLMI